VDEYRCQKVLIAAGGLSQNLQQLLSGRLGLKNKQQQRMRRQLKFIAGFKTSVAAFNDIRVHQQGPLCPSRAGWYRKSDALRGAIEHQKQGSLLTPLADARRLRPAIQQHPEGSHVRVSPLIALHLRSVGIDPGDILYTKFVIVVARQK
jgi:hypothetical protein